MKTLLLSTLLVASLSSLGCAADRHGMSYDIMIDPSLNDSQKEDIVEGAQAWEAAIPGLTFTFDIAPCQGTGNWYHTICFFLDNGTPIMAPTGRSYASTEWSVDTFHPNDAAGDSATVHIWSSMVTEYADSPYMFRDAVCHELGHATSHQAFHIAQGNLMSPGADGSIIEPITEQDVNYFWNVR
jgi:hypothetical protein